MSRLAKGVAALDRWLAHGPVRAVLIGPEGRGKSTLLQTWLHRVDADVAPVWVSRRHGTARQDVALNQLYAGLAGALPSPRRVGERPHGLREMRRDLAQMVAEGRPAGGRPLLVVIDGVHEAVDWGFDTLSNFLAEIGPGVRVVVSAPVEGCLRGTVSGHFDTQTIHLAPLGVDEVVNAVRERLGSVPDNVVAQLVRVSAGEPLILEALLAQLGPQLRAVSSLSEAEPGMVGALEWLIKGHPEGYSRALKWLARAVSPLPLAELRAIAQAPLESLGMGEPPDSLVTLDESGISFRHVAWADVVHAHMTEPERREIDERFAAHGASIFADVVAHRVAHRDVSNYVREGLRIHLDRAGATLTERLALVSSDWLGAWLARPEATSAFLADVDATDAFVRGQLTAPAPAPELAARLIARARCLLVASSLRAMIAADERRRVRTAAKSMAEEADDEANDEANDEAEWQLDLPPVGQDPFDVRYRIGDAGGRARALSQLAEELEGAARAEVLAWALEAARDEAADPAGLAELVSHWKEDEPVAIAREAVERLRGAGSEGRLGRVRVARYLSFSEAAELARGAFEELAAQGAWEELPALSEAAAELEPAVVRSIWDWAEELAPPHQPVALSRLCGKLPLAERDAGVRTALAAVLSTASDAYLPGEACVSLCALAPHAPASALEDLISACEMAHSFRSLVVAQIAARASDLGQPGVARALIATLASPSEELAARCALLSHLPPEDQGMAWAQLAAELLEAEGRHQLAEANAAAWAAAVGAAPVLELARAIGATRRTFLAVAAVAPAFAENIVAELLAQAKASPDDEELFALTPFASAMNDDGARVFCNQRLEEIAWKPRPDLLNDWTKDDLGHLAPLLARVGGDNAVFGVARAIVDVARWLP